MLVKHAWPSVDCRVPLYREEIWQPTERQLHTLPENSYFTFCSCFSPTGTTGSGCPLSAGPRDTPEEEGNLREARVTSPVFSDVCLSGASSSTVILLI